MKRSQYAISWIYGEFRFSHLSNTGKAESWLVSFPVTDVESLARAMAEVSQHIDLTHGGSVVIAYEDDMHTHEFFEVPEMASKDLEKYLQRKVEQNKPFNGKASWCYHDAKYSEQGKGILLHLLPQEIVDATIRICEEFYLTPRLFIPLTAVVSSQVKNYSFDGNYVLVVVALFSQRTEIVVTMSDGEVLFVRELPYAGYLEGQPRLVIDINRTISYVKQQFAMAVNRVCLIGEKAEAVQKNILTDISVDIHYDQDGLDALFWAKVTSGLKTNISANFIPLLTRKRINKTLFYRVAVWSTMLLVITSLFITATVEKTVSARGGNSQSLDEDISHLENSIKHYKLLNSRREEEKNRLRILRANATNIPAIFINHLGDIVPRGLVIVNANIKLKDRKWNVMLTGKSQGILSSDMKSLDKMEQTLKHDPWNMTITRSWKSAWYKQLTSGSAGHSAQSEYTIAGWMK